MGPACASRTLRRQHAEQRPPHSSLLPLQGNGVFHRLVGGLDDERVNPGATAEALRVLLPVAGGAAALNVRDVYGWTPLSALRGLGVRSEAHADQVADSVRALLAAGADLQALQGMEEARSPQCTLPEHLVLEGLRDPGALSGARVSGCKVQGAVTWNCECMLAVC